MLELVLDFISVKRVSSPHSLLMKTPTRFSGVLARAKSPVLQPTKSRGFFQTIGVLFALAAGASSQAQIVSTWIGGSTGNWSDGAKWNTNPNAPKNGLPSVGDLYDAVFGVNATVTLTENVEIERLSSTAALTLQGAFTLDLNEGFDLNSSAGRTLSSSVVLNLLGGTSTFRGGGNLNMGSGAVLSNHAVLEWETDADFVYTGSTLPQFNNLSGATFRKTGGTDKTTIPGGYIFNNSGTIDIDSGQLELSGGTYNLNDGTAFTGTGLTRAVSGTFTLSGTLSADQNFEIAGATLGGTHTLSGGVWKMAGGAFSGAGTTTIASGATLELSGGSAKSMSGSRVLDNQGTVIFGGTAALTLGFGATLNNSGLFDVQSEADFSYGGSTLPVINNLAGGTFRKSVAGANETSVGS